MKITTELHNKITFAVSQKYAAAREEIRKAEETFTQEATNRLLLELNTVCNLYPNIEHLCKGRFCKTKLELVQQNMYSVPEVTQARKNFREKHDALNKEIENETNNIIIQISYGKTLDDVVKAFANYGLPF